MLVYLAVLVVKQQKGRLRFKAICQQKEKKKKRKKATEFEEGKKICFDNY